VWTGLSTRHVRAGLQEEVDVESLRRLWRVISPFAYFHKFAEKEKRSALIHCTYDTTVLPPYSQALIAEAEKLHIDLKAVAIPCGHYTLGETPFKFLAGYQVCSFLMRNL